MSRLHKSIILIVLSFTLSSCEQETEQTYLEFEEKVFYELFGKMSDKLYNDIRIIPTLPPPSPDYLIKSGFNTINGYNKALEAWKKSEDYQKKENNWKKKRDSILNDSNLIYIAFPDSINGFKKEDTYELINHFNKQKLIVDTENFDLISGFQVDFDKLKSDNKKLRFKPKSEFPKGRDIWEANYNFNFRGSFSFSRILFDKTKSFGVLNAEFVKGPLNGDGCKIFIKKDENGNWIIEKIKGTWIS